jgi:uncharacterized membrane protein
LSRYPSQAWSLLAPLRPSGLGANDLPYTLPIHPNLVHLTIGLFVIAIAFDLVGALYPVEKRLFRFLALPVTRGGFHDVGWYNLLLCAGISFLTVAAGFYEMLLAQPIAGVTSAIGLDGITTMLWHGDGRVARLPAFRLAPRLRPPGAVVVPAGGGAAVCGARSARHPRRRAGG